MGNKSFYVRAKLQNNDFSDVEKILKSNKIYQKYFSYPVVKEEGVFEIYAARACFFSATQIIYDLLLKINLINPIEHVESWHTKRLFDFENYLKFFCWMYQLWEDGIYCNYKSLGVFLIPYSETYQMKWRLERNYFVPFPERECGMENNDSPS